MRRYICFLIIIGSVLLVSCGAEKRNSSEIIEDLAVCYGTYGEDGEEQEGKLLNELRSTDPDLYDKWDRIMELWKTVNTDLSVHEGILPDGLPNTEELCLVALGFQLKPDGTMKEELIHRLEVVKACAEKYPNARILCTGGKTSTGNREATEAGEMEKWLVENGVDPDRIIVEQKAKTTAQNAMYCYEILHYSYPQIKQIAMISSDYHLATGTLLFGAEFILKDEKPEEGGLSLVSNAAYKTPRGTLSSMFQAGALIELSGNRDAAFDIYCSSSERGKGGN